MERKRKIRITVYSIAGVLLIIIGILIFYFAKKNKEPTVPIMTGGAEAVMTTPVKVLNGASTSTAYDEELYYPLGIALAEDAVVVADHMNDRIQILGESYFMRIGKSGSSEVSYAASGGLIDGYLEHAEFKKPTDIAFLNGDIIVCDTENHAIRKISNNAVITIAGGTGQGYANGKEAEVRFHSPRAVTVDKDGLIYVADTMNHCIRTIDAEGEVELFAGTPEQSGYVDGELTEAKFFEPSGLCIGFDGELYVADSANHSIRMVKDGVVTTVAGKPEEINDTTGYPVGGLIDGNNADARFQFPQALTVLSNGDIYVADTMNHSIRLISEGVTKTVIGGGDIGKFYASVENLKISRPSGIASDGQSLYITDTMNNTIVIVPITESLKQGRPLREELLRETGVDTETRYAYNGVPRLYVDGERVDMNKVQPWNTVEAIYIPVRPLFEAMGAVVAIDSKTDILTIELDGYETELKQNQSYFLMKGTAVMTFDEIARLFPYTIEWFPEFSVIAVSKDKQK